MVTVNSREGASTDNLDSADSRLLNVTSWGLKRATVRHNDRPEFRMIGVAWRVVVEGLIAYSVVVDRCVASAQ